ncbi:hypothetical protein [Micromonospora sp. NBC_01813]|nr:hypothetical protein [Micromonospora sp. NBC_01813]WSA07858.1 hypothetical protein OG958_27120 [Micromonospora sp. NBC_01813]
MTPADRSWHPAGSGRATFAEAAAPRRSPQPQPAGRNHVAGTG